MENQNLCPICKTLLTEKPKKEEHLSGDKHLISCSRCGRFILTGSVMSWFSQKLEENNENIPLLSYTIRKMQMRKEIPILDTYLVGEILKTELPSLPDQINNLLLWLGGSSDPGMEVTMPIETIQTIIGAKTPNGATLVITYLKEKHLLENVGSQAITGLKLTMSGWEKYDQINRGAILSRRAFMAMKFGEDDLDQFFFNYLKPAVQTTGFDLYRLDENPKAGLIDDRLRVEIRNSRFLISDLTHENAGAYWEAGFAEGLGKPVIYTCEKNKFESNKTHFDTNHHLTVIWDKENLEIAMKQLVATIRATLPDEAMMIDNP